MDKKLNYILFVLIVILAFAACHSNKKHDRKNDLSLIDSIKKHPTTESKAPTKPTGIQKLKASLKTKDEANFLKQFPKDFKQFNDYFGWNSESDEPEELYDVSLDYINYWFELLSKVQYKEQEENIIRICLNGRWEADAVNYFQDKALNYIKENKRYSLIEKLKESEIKSVLFFLFDGPHPEYDVDFYSGLSMTNQSLLYEVFADNFYDLDEENKETDEDPNDVSSYSLNSAYFLKQIDINNDNILDRVISSKPYEGDELLLFIKKNDTYELALKTVNFSEDGGHRIADILATDNGFVVKTVFPDGGLNQAAYFIEYQNNQWILTNTVYSIQSGNEEDAFIYECDIKQDLNVGSTDFYDTLKSIPDKANREKVCTKIMPEKNQTATAIEDEISGKYELIKGHTIFIGSENDEILSANIVIEKLSETDYGFYSAYKVKKITPVGDFGVFRNHKNTFHNLFICKEDEGYSKDNFTTGIYLNNQVIIEKKGDTLAMIRYGSNFRRYMMYKKKKPEANFSIYLIKTLKATKLNYEDFLLKYKKAKNYDKNKLQIEYFFKDSIYKTRHIHTEGKETPRNVYSYQNPFQNGKFVKYDSIFYQSYK